MKQKPPYTVETLQSEAFMEHAIERHRGAVLRLALARTRNAADAQDVAQDALSETQPAASINADQPTNLNLGTVPKLRLHGCNNSIVRAVYRVRRWKA